MKTIFLAAAFGFAATAAASASCTSQTFGNQTVTNCTNGERYNSMQFGNQTFTNGRDAAGNQTRGNSVQFGNQTFYSGPMYGNR